MGEGYAAIQKGGRAACSGVWGQFWWLIVLALLAPKRKHSNMWWLLNHTGTHAISNRSWQVCYTLIFTVLKTLIALKLKSLWVWPKFSLIYNKFLGRYAKNWIFHQNNILQYFFSKLVHGYIFNHAVCKIGLSFHAEMCALCRSHPVRGLQ